MPVVVPTRFHPRGEALADEGRRAVRVWGGIPGEPAEVRIEGRGGHQDYATWTGSPAPSPDRVPPACEHWRRCGGCAWMHLAPAAAREARRELVRAALAEAGVAAEADPVVPCPDGDAGYRHLVKLVAAPTRGGVRFGAYGRGTHDVVGVEGCGVLAPALRKFAGLRIDAGDVGPDALADLRHLVVRASRSSGRTLATVVARRDTPAVRRAARALPADGVALHVNDAPGDAIFAREGGTVRLRGDATLEELVGETRLRIGPTDFFQTNPSTAARIWADLPRPRGTLLDLYGGVGAVALVVGRGATAVFGVEESPRAVARARENAALNGVAATFEAGAVGSVEIPGAFAGGMVVVNPPRGGLRPGVAEAVLALRPSPLVYVSCEPRTLARDLARFVAGGLRIERVTPYDMFPQTPHVETVAVLG